ncbi:uncharacterized protein DUF4911 [Desulfobotulus alkaliphilus]|uniref:Uncharacterized protein DUF4911 n=1 Tax=Desulfobotulus alkaliphilus TaxID=622671 RepID=A0A562RQH1_9BACT|nr:DUF4911 domain-containing protein [Desulfobotulus alkaliphilus]TWI71163.1 uncharacterized protein DUF4911 [Desulfobotulus alkaliphilus]
METEALFFWMNRSEIGFFRFLLEAYEGMGAVTTLDREGGLVMVRVAPGCVALVEEVAASLGPGASLVPLSRTEVENMGFSTQLCPG